MIQFQLRQEAYDTRDVVVTVTTRDEQLGAVVEAFKEFLIHAGFAYSSVERVMYVEGDHQGFRGDGNPKQGDFFADDKEDFQPDAGDLFT